MNEGFIKTPIEPRKSDTKLREIKTEAEASRKKSYEAEAEDESIKTAFKDAEAEAEANNFRMLGSRSRHGSQHFREKPGFRKPKRKPKPASNPTLVILRILDLGQKRSCWILGILDQA